MSPDEDPFEGLDEDAYLPPESDVDPEEDLDAPDEEPEEEPEPAAEDGGADEEPEEEPEDDEDPEEEPEDEEGEPGDDEDPEEEPEDEESEPEDEGEPGEEPAGEEHDAVPEPVEEEEGVVRIPPTPGAGDVGDVEDDVDEAAGDPWDGMDDDAYLPPESDVDPEEDLDAPGEAGEEPPEAPAEVEPEPGPDEPPEPPEEPERTQDEPLRRTPEEPPEEDLRIEDVLREEEPAEASGPAGPPGPGDEEEGPLPAAGPGEDEEPAYPGPPEPGEEPEEGPPGGPPEPFPEEGGAPAGPPTEGADREPGDEPSPDLPGVGAVLVAEVLDGLGSRRVAWTILGLALALVGAAYWRGLSDTGWFLRTAFALTPVLLLPAFAYRFPVERRTGHDRVLATYPPGPGRFLVGRYLAFLLLGLAYLAVALLVAGPVAWYSGPHWVQQVPRHLGVGVLMVLATASGGVLLGTLLGRVRGRLAATLGLAVAALWYLAPRGVYLAETTLDGTVYAPYVVRLLHLSPAVAGTGLLTQPQVFPVWATMAVKAGAAALLAVVFLALGSLAYVWLQEPGGWKVHPVLVALFALLTVASLAAPLALPMDIHRGDAIVQKPHDSGVDVTVDAVLDPRGASGGRPVEGALTQGVSYDGFLTLEVSRENASTSRTLENVVVEVRSPELGVDDGDDLGSVTAPASGTEEVPVEVPVTVDSVPGAYRPFDATAFVEVTSDEASFSLVKDDLDTAASGGSLVFWMPAVVAGGVAVVEAAVLVAARRQV